MNLLILEGISISPYVWGTLIFSFIVFGVGFALGGFGGMFSECSGIINIALDGAMLLGAFSGLLVCSQIGDALKGNELLNNWAFVNFIYLIGLFVCVIVAFAFSFLLSFVSIRLKADQTIVGTALNSLVAAIVLIGNTIHRAADLPEMDVSMFYNVMLYKFEDMDFFNGMFSNLNITIIVGIVLIVVLK